MKLSDLDIINREPSFPIYIGCSGDIKSKEMIPKEYEPGRVVYLNDNREFGTGLVDRSVEDFLGINDIVFVPLYLGCENFDIYCSRGTVDKIQAYEDNISFLKSIAPNVKAILVGNAGPEMGYKEFWLNENYRPRSFVSDLMCEFATVTSDLIIEAGGTPCYAPTDWDLAIDCYFGKSKFRNLINKINAIQICFCGFQLFGLGKDRLEYPIVPHNSDNTFWTCCPIQEGEPWSKLTEYLKGYNFIMSGLEYVEGLKRGNDIPLKEHGFDAGLCAGPNIHYLMN